MLLRNLCYKKEQQLPTLLFGATFKSLLDLWWPIWPWTAKPVTAHVICWFSPCPCPGSTLSLWSHLAIGLFTNSCYHCWTCYVHLAGIPWGCPFAGEVFALPALLSFMLPACLHSWDGISSCCSLVHVIYWISETSQMTMCLDNWVGPLPTFRCAKSLARCHWLYWLKRNLHALLKLQLEVLDPRAS